MPSNLPKQIEATVTNFSRTVEARAEQWEAARDPAAFRAMELQVAAEARAVADEITALVLQSITSDAQLQAQASMSARQAYPSRYRHGGHQEAKVTLLSGKQVSVKVEYLKRNHRPSPRKRRKAKRGSGGSGMYPVLAALGIWFGVTPALAAEVCRQVTDSDSVRTGRSALARRGIELGHQRTLRIVNRTAGRAVEQRNQWLGEVREGPATAGPLAGKRVVVAIDGGRLRQRSTSGRGRRRSKTGHRRYDTPWREPKQLVIYVVNSRTGKTEQSFVPVYDATLGDCNDSFSMLVGYLKALGAHQASRLIFVGDGAKWIWERAAPLARQLGLPKHKCVEVIDWFHAVEVLHTIADIPASWNKQQRHGWVRRAKNALYKGKTGRIAEMIDELAVGRRAKEVGKHRDYFVRNHKRMQYARFEEQHIPIGSGAVESAIRRVVNQRLKACGTFWLEHNAEGMLLLRSYLKCGRFDDLIDWSLAMAAPWWPPASDDRDLRRGPLLHARPDHA